jgi:hypothetical protein
LGKGNERAFPVGPCSIAQEHTRNKNIFAGMRAIGVRQETGFFFFLPCGQPIGNFAAKERS